MAKNKVRKTIFILIGIVALIGAISILLTLTGFTFYFIMTGHLFYGVFTFIIAIIVEEIIHWITNQYHGE